MNIDNAAIAKQLGFSREEMIARFGEPGTKTPQEIGNSLGLSSDKILEIFGTEQTDNTNTDTNSANTNNNNNNNTDTFQSAKDDKYEEVANALGYDSLSVSAVMKYVESGNVNGAPETVVPQVASDLGLPQSFVSNVLAYLNNGQI